VHSLDKHYYLMSTMIEQELMIIVCDRLGFGLDKIQPIQQKLLAELEISTPIEVRLGRMRALLNEAGCYRVNPNYRISWWRWFKMGLQMRRSRRNRLFGERR
jgi:hypothetical protein